jgi:RNA polymerase sigma factor (sigma-70 family)
MEGTTLAAGSRQGLGAPLRVLGDEALMRLAARGNEAAFAAIFERHHQALYRYALTILGNREDAFDAVQNAIVKLLRSLPGERRDLKLKPWLYRIVHNEAISMIRLRSPRSEGAVEDLGTEDANHDRLRAQAIIADLATLVDQQRSAVTLRELNGLSHAEIGGVLKISEAAAKQAVYEGRVALQQIEEGREMVCSDVQKSLSANDRRLIRGRRVRSHLRSCPACRSFQESIGERRVGLAGIAPLPATLSAKLLSGAFGGGGGPAGGLMVGAGAGAGHVLGAGALAKVGAAALLMVGGGIVIEREIGRSNATPPVERPDTASVPPTSPSTHHAQIEVASADPRGASGGARPGSGAIEVKTGGSAQNPQKAQSGQAESRDGGRDAGANGSNASGANGSGSGESENVPVEALPVAEPSEPVKPPHTHPTGPAHGQEIAASHDPGDPGNSAGHAQDPASPPGLSGQSSVPTPSPTTPDLPAAATDHGQGLGPKPK